MSTENSRWEPKDVNVPVLFYVVMIVVVGTVLSALMSGGLFRALSLHKDATDPRAPALAAMPETLSEPRLQAAPRADLAAYQAAQQRELSQYGWIDREHGLVRLPIARAMDLLVECGLPATPPAGTDLQFRQRQGGGVPPAPGTAATQAVLPAPGAMTSTPTLPPARPTIGGTPP